MNHIEAMAAVVARYTDLNAARAWIESSKDLRERLIRCQAACVTSRDPRGRFGLDSVPGDVSAYYAGALAEAVAEVRPIRDALVAAYARYQAWDTAWARCARDGFGPGDSGLIGAA